MTSKEHILHILEINKGNTISGEDLASHLKISRAAVWKAINELRKDGHSILAVTNKGYCLSPESDVISLQGIQPYLDAKSISHDIHVYKTLDSTNQMLKQMALGGALPGTVVIADEQLKGKGRMGRSFFSPADTGIYMSLLLKPTFDVSKAVLITTAAAVAVCFAIEKVTGIQCGIKWVNDIYVGDKKICGILTEAVTDFESGHIESIVLGIGINVTTSQENFPKELEGVAGSLFDHENWKGKNSEPLDVPAENINKIFSRNKLIAEIINQLTKINHNLESREFIKEYKARSIVLGKEINVLKGGALDPHSGDDTPPIATAVDIDDDGGLVVQYKNGSTETLNSGEISIRLK